MFASKSPTTAPELSANMPRKSLIVFIGWTNLARATPEALAWAYRSHCGRSECTAVILSCERKGSQAVFFKFACRPRCGASFARWLCPMSLDHQQSLISSLKNSLELGFTFAEIATSKETVATKMGSITPYAKAKGALAEVTRFENAVVGEIRLEIHTRS